jgi:orotate phosphoribosyltransferase
MDRTILGTKIYQTSRLSGNFLLRSGQTSNQYFDKYLFESNPEILSEIAKHLERLIPPATEVLAGLELGGIPIATALSLKTGLPVVFVRKEAKEYGTCKLAEGVDIQERKLCVIEDVVTTGGQIIESTKELRKFGAIVENVLCVIERNQDGSSNLLKENLNLESLFTLDELEDLSKEGAK